MNQPRPTDPSNDPALAPPVESAVSPQPTGQQQDAHDFLGTVPIFASLDDEAHWRLAQLARPLHFAAGSLVMIEGDETDSFYVVRSGVAEVVRNNGTSKPALLAQLEPGSYFGELGLLTDTPRTATVMVAADRDLDVLAFDAQTFHEIIAEHVLVFRMQRAGKRLQGTVELDRIDLSSLTPFSQLSAADLAFVTDSAEERTLEPHEAVFEQGQKGDRFYVLLRGALEVQRDGQRIATLSPGDFFGETALLFTRRRTATVNALLPSCVWSITRSAFGRVVRRQLLGNPAVWLAIEARRRAS